MSDANPSSGFDENRKIIGYEVGEFRIMRGEDGEFVCTKSGKKFYLGKKASEVLWVLCSKSLESPDRIVKIDDLWNVVESRGDHDPNDIRRKRIQELRQVVGKDNILTIPCVGYRINPPIQPIYSKDPESILLDEPDTQVQKEKQRNTLCANQERMDREKAELAGRVSTLTHQIETLKTELEQTTGHNGALTDRIKALQDSEQALGKRIKRVILFRRFSAAALGIFLGLLLAWVALRPSPKDFVNIRQCSLGAYPQERDPDKVYQIELEKETDGVSFNIPNPSDYSNFNMEIFTASGKKIRERYGVKNNAYGNLSVVMSTDLFGSGHYVLSIHPVGNKDEAREYKLHIIKKGGD